GEEFRHSAAVLHRPASSAAQPLLGAKPIVRTGSAAAVSSAAPPLLQRTVSLALLVSIYTSAPRVCSTITATGRPPIVHVLASVPLWRRCAPIHLRHSRRRNERSSPEQPPPRTPENGSAIFAVSVRRLWSLLWVATVAPLLEQ